MTTIKPNDEGRDSTADPVEMDSADVAGSSVDSDGIHSDNGLGGTRLPGVDDGDADEGVDDGRYGGVDTAGAVGEADEPVDDANEGQGFAARLVGRWTLPKTRDQKIRFYLGTLPALVVPTVIMLFATGFFADGPNGEASLIFADNTPTGGDFGAHVWGPSYLFEHVLSNGWYNGWSMDWYAGLPAYRFYMVVPALLILIFDIVLPYGVAMKLVSVLGVVTIPAMCWVFGRLGNFRYPMPELFAFAGLAFVLDESWSILGGNLKSTMAGEFSFSIALSLAILGLGLFVKGLQTGRYKTWAAVVLSLAAVSHGLVLIFLAIVLTVTSFVWYFSARGATQGGASQRLRYISFVGIGLVLLSAWWVVPFVANHDYMTDMKYTPEPSTASYDSFWAMYFPHTPFLDILVTTLAVAGIYFGVLRRQLNVISIGSTYLVLAILIAITSRWGLPLLGLLWNPRLLPFFYLCRNILMAYGAFELMATFYNGARNKLADRPVGIGPATIFSTVYSLSILTVLGFMFQVMIPGVTGTRPDTDPEGNAINRYYVGPFQATTTNSKAAGSGWARYNFRGYEGGGKWEEYRNVVNTMADLGEEYGCGRAQWENHGDNGQYGTTMALMLLPYWTDSCIGSMEGLFFEASGTTPYHFLSTAAMSEKSSNPVRGLRYTNNDATVGVEELQALGVKYTMLRSAAAQAQADSHPDLTQVAISSPWKVYLIADSAVVEPLAVQPVVVNERGGDRRERLLEISTSWFQHQDEWAAMPANDGPDNWQRIDVAVDEQSVEINDDGRKVKVDIVRPVDEIKVIEPTPVEVANVEIRNQSLGFDVSEPGTPIEVKVSYFPNWKAEGADGPYRIGPNMMVVIPTDTHVELTYGRTWLDYFSVLLTIGGIVWCVVGYRRGDIAMRPLRFGAYFERLQLAGGSGLGGLGADGFDRAGAVPVRNLRSADDQPLEFSSDADGAEAHTTEGQPAGDSTTSRDMLAEGAEAGAGKRSAPVVTSGQTAGRDGEQSNGDAHGGANGDGESVAAPSTAEPDVGMAQNSFAPGSAPGSEVDD